MEYRTLIIEMRGSVCVIRMNQPESMNALGFELRTDLVNCLNKLSENKGTRVVILTSTAKAFCAGGDLRELRDGMTPDEGRKYIHHVSRIIRAIVSLDKPVIAAVNGAAMGAGFSIALACDLIVASEYAKFSQVFATLGLIPDLGGTYFLPRLVGLQRAKEFAFRAKMIDPHELARVGVVNYVVPHEDLEKKALELASEIGAGPPIALGLTKLLMNRSLHLDLKDALELEAQSQAICMQSQDYMEGVAAFYEKRRPRFKGV